MPKPFLQVISARVSRGRVGKPVADYLVGALTGRDTFELEVIDLAEVNLPLMDEPNHPRVGRYTHDHTKAWSATISRGDAYLIVLPEYNFSFTGPLKNALDHLSKEWAGKPVALASYGGISGGLRAAKTMARELRPDAVISSSTYPFDTYFAQRLARLSGARLIHEVHDLWPLTPIELGGHSPRHPLMAAMAAAASASRRADSAWPA